MKGYEVRYKQNLTKEYVDVYLYIKKQIKAIEDDVPIRRDSDWQKAREGAFRDIAWLMDLLTIESRWELE